VKDVPITAIEIPHNGTFKIADSEVSGSMHRLEAPPENFNVYKDVDNTIYVHFRKSTLLNHCNSNGTPRDHEPIIIGDNGIEEIKKIRKEIEYDPFEEVIREVTD
jgi:hypothetical protein